MHVNVQSHAKEGFLDFDLGYKLFGCHRKIKFLGKFTNMNLINLKFCNNPEKLCKAYSFDR